MPNESRHFAILLGAGASHGAAFPKITPPLDGGFLATSKSLLSRKGRGKDSNRTAWNQLIRRLKSAGLKAEVATGWRLEQLSTYLEARANMPSLQHSRGRPADYREALNALTQVVCRTLVKANGTNACVFHKNLFEHVDPKTVITFNYDLVADQTLLEMGRLAWWRSEYGGTTMRAGASKSNYTRQKPRRRGSGEIQLLKLHGSMNWHQHSRGDGCSLVASGNPDQRMNFDTPSPNPMIVPPVAAKMSIQRGSLRELWSHASRALRQAPGWVIWGYSFPLTDTVTQVLCRSALGKNKRPKPVYIINPDPSVKFRVEEALDKVRVRQWPSIERFLMDFDVLRVRDGFSDDN